MFVHCKFFSIVCFEAVNLKSKVSPRSVQVQRLSNLSISVHTYLFFSENPKWEPWPQFLQVQPLSIVCLVGIFSSFWVLWTVTGLTLDVQVQSLSILKENLWRIDRVWTWHGQRLDVLCTWTEVWRRLDKDWTKVGFCVHVQATKSQEYQSYNIWHELYLNLKLVISIADMSKYCVNFIP